MSLFQSSPALFLESLQLPILLEMHLLKLIE